MENKFDDSTRLRDIDEGLRQQILDLLGKSSELLIKGSLRQYYICLKEIFIRIEPFEFTKKDNLSIMTNQIDQNIDILGEKAFDNQHRYELAERQVEFKDYVNEYKRFVVHSLKDLNLYLRIIKRRDDPELQFSEETFTSSETLLGEKKELLSGLTGEEIIKFLTPRQIHDAHARWKIEKNL